MDFLPARMRSRLSVGPGDCWNWNGCVTTNGYGMVRHRGKGMRPHRVVFEFLGTPVPDDMTVDHLCRNKLCCNPAHLEVVTNATNVRRWADSITECPQGHLYNEANTYIDKRGYRSCKTCAVARLRARRVRSLEG